MLPVRRRRGATVREMSRQRLDTLLAERGDFPSRSAAAAAVRAGEVRVGSDGPFAVEAERARGCGGRPDRRAGARFVSRGGTKLENALEALPVAVSGRDCLDVGASTGGFTDCLLQRGAARVAAIDVAHGAARLGASQRRPGDRDRAAQRPLAERRRPARSPLRWRRSTSPSSRWRRCSPRSPPSLRRTARSWPWSSRSSSSAASGSARAASSATPALAARRSRRGRRRQRVARPRRSRLRLLRAARPKGQPGDLHLVLARSGEAVADLDDGDPRGRAVSARGAHRRAGHPLAPAGRQRGSEGGDRGSGERRAAGSLRAPQKSPSTRASLSGIEVRRGNA